MLLKRMGFISLCLAMMLLFGCGKAKEKDTQEGTPKKQGEDAKKKEKAETPKKKEANWFQGMKKKVAGEKAAEEEAEELPEQELPEEGAE
jgi:CDGSH-type Zn-finger protein